VLTGEYPPQIGGVSDYTRLVARGLAALGDHVVVWAPPAGETGAPHDQHVDVRRLPDWYGTKSLRVLSEALDHARRPHRVLVQYVPHAFGCRAANLLFCLWLRSRRRDAVWVMFHEVAYPFGLRGGLSPNLLAVVNRAMAWLVGGAAERAFVSIPAWRSGVGAVTRAGTPVTWLPVPTSIAVVDDRHGADEVAARYGQAHPLVGHFGTYGDLIAPLVEGAIEKLLARADCRVLLMGHNSALARAHIVSRHPELAERIVAAGSLASEEVSRHFRACALMLQPYPDGISSRRTSAMAALAHGLPIVTTEGPLTEPIWRTSKAVVLVPSGDSERLAAEAAALLVDEARRADLSRRGAALYDAQFDVRHTIAALKYSS
jgi:glycosyltransferase involved in cell wall biosynthesis